MLLPRIRAQKRAHVFMFIKREQDGWQFPVWAWLFCHLMPTIKESVGHALPAVGVLCVHANVSHYAPRFGIYACRCRPYLSGAVKHLGFILS